MRAGALLLSVSCVLPAVGDPRPKVDLYGDALGRTPFSV
jgi:hypothetical protein